MEIVKKENDEVQCKNSFVSNIEPDSAHIVDHIVWDIPHDASGEYVVKMRVFDKEGTVLSENYTDIIVR